ncbi:hypothetical protein [Salininema proteolyticum]|uniref:Gas vesicle protein n=1 Tax=Salininema proteolyticum TaxID=1607685 RepID=A0ABV8U0A6_9ACTN
MFKRIMWVGVGAVVGVVVVRKLTQKARETTPQAVAGRLAESGEEAKGAFQRFWTDVSNARHEKEEELFAAFERGENLAPLLRGDDDDE